MANLPRTLALAIHLVPVAAITMSQLSTLCINSHADHVPRASYCLVTLAMAPTTRILRITSKLLARVSAEAVEDEDFIRVVQSGWLRLELDDAAPVADGLWIA